MRMRPTTGHLGLSLLVGATMLGRPGAALAQDSATATVLEDIEVTAQSNEILKQDGYVAKQDRVGTKVDTPIVKIPQAVSVVTQEQIEDQKPRTLNDALGYTASANPNSFGYDTRYDAFFLRGFQAYLQRHVPRRAAPVQRPFGMVQDRALRHRGRHHPQGSGFLALRRERSGRHRQCRHQASRRMTHYREVEILIGEHDRYQAALDASGPVDGRRQHPLPLHRLGRDSDTDL